MTAPLLIVVTGPPASGKTGIAEELAQRLRIPYVSKDLLKEVLFEQFGSGDELQEPIDHAGLALLFSMVEAELEAGVSVVAESNFDSRTDTASFRRLTEEYDLRLVQIHCDADHELLVSRFVERAESGERHPGHDDDASDADELREQLAAGLWAPLDVPGEVIELDLADLGSLDWDGLLDRLRAAI